MDVTNQAVENLVTQFSSALDFYRELVQNSIDAGSAAIEIWLDFIPDESGGAGGVIEIHVDDAGEGMNEEVIDEQLTTLFSSTKEDDMTKIGKFGIGFVSVFALRPKGVLVQTGRDGEYWEVFFDQDRSFFKSPLDAPIEGTQITLFVEGDRARYTELVGRSLETIDHWCRHSEAEINFEDRASLDGSYVHVNKPFSVDGECPTSVERDGTVVVLAYSDTPAWGFYNKGLALAVVRGKTDLVPEHLSHVAFRIKSRYLEHTLSRETVMRDENYDKAMVAVVEAAEGPLRANLVAEIGALLEIVTGPAEDQAQAQDRTRARVEARARVRASAQARRRWTASERGRYFRLMSFLAREGDEALAPFEEAPLFLGLDGRSYSLAQLSKQAAADGRVYVEAETSGLVDQLSEQGTPVIMVQGHDELGDDPARVFGPVSRVLANGLSRGFFSSGVVARVLDKLRSEAEVGGWTRAGDLITRPVDVLVGVDLVEDQPKASALVAAASSILQRSLGEPQGVLARLVSRWSGGEPKFGYGRLVCAQLHGAPGGRMPLFVVAHEIAPMMAIPTQELMIHDQSERPEAAVNAEHVHFRKLLRLAESEPEVAAYCLAKSLLLDADRGLLLDPQLISAALDPAWELR